MGSGAARNLLSTVHISELEVFFFTVFMYYKYSGEIKGRF